MTAKERFQQSPMAKKFNDTIDGQMMTMAFDMAMLEFQSRFSKPPDMATAAANEWRRQGAQEFLSILLHLNEKKPEPAKTNSGLDYRV